jgi:hypothetical protein
MKNEDLLKESIQLILNYEARSVVVEFKKYKTLEDIKEKVYELFYPVKNKISLYLNNKNLEPLIDQPIGYIFSGKSLVNLKVLNEGVIDSPYKLVKRFQDTNIINDVTNVYSRLNFQKSANKTNMASLLNDRYDIDVDSNSKLGNNIRKNIKEKSLILSKNKLILLKSELNKNNNDNDNHNYKNKKLLASNSADNLDIFNQYNKNNIIKGKLPPITQKNINKKLNIDIVSKKSNNRINSTKNKKNKNMNNILYNKCNNCFINKISTYCRKCDLFLCHNCSTNKKSTHQEHKSNFIDLDIYNNPSNITKYKDLLITDFNKWQNFFKNLDKKNLDTIYENQKKELNKFSYENIINKLDEDVQNLVKKANNMKSSMKQFEFNEHVNDDEQRVKEICDNEKKVLKKFDVYEYKSQFQPFFVLNKFERNMAKYFNNYEASNDQRIYIKSQIELMFDNVENEVDNVLEDIEKIIGDRSI